jgi:MFS transporter, PPP family, 3-phenylpropionic acid transporter
MHADLSTLPRPSWPPTVYTVAAYVALYAAIGAQAPYFPLYFQSLGLKLDAVGLLSALSAGVALLGGPLWGVAADHFGRSRLVLPVAAGTAALGAAMLAVVAGPLAVAPLVAAVALSMAGVSPILDTRALEAVAEDRNRYGRLRVWGSISFIVSVVLVGWVIEQTGGSHGLFLVLVPALAATAFVGLGLPSRSVVPSLPRLTGISAVLRSRPLASFLAAVLVAWSASAAINGFLSIYLIDIGTPPTLVGMSWALGALVEVPLMFAFPWLARRVGLERLLLVGAGLMLLRAVAIVLLVDPILAALTMLIHGGGFALLLVGGVTYVSRHAPAGAAATAQGMLSAVTFGLAMVAGPGVGGLVARAIGLPAMFSLAGVASGAALIGLGWALRVWRRQPAGG